MIVFLVLLVFFSFNLYTNYFHYKWFLLTCIVSFMSAYPFFRDFGIFTGILIVYMSISATYVSMYGVNRHFAHPSRGLNNNLAYTTSRSLIAILSVGIIYNYSEYFIWDVFKYIKWLLLINCVWTLLPKKILTKFFTFTSENKTRATISGFGANLSVNCTFLSLMAPFLLHDFDQTPYLNGGILLLTLLATIKTTAATGLLAFLTSMAFFIVYKFDFNIYAIMSILALFILLLFIGDKFGINDQKKSKKIKIKRLWDLSGRGDIWKISKKVFLIKGTKLFGIGLGSYQIVVPALKKDELKQKIEIEVNKEIRRRESIKKPMSKDQIQNYTQFVYNKTPKEEKYRYIWAHSDLLQFITEGGVIGSLLLILTIASILFVAILTKNYVFLTFFIAYGINSLTNFPNHMAPDILLLIIMLKYLAT